MSLRLYVCLYMSCYSVSLCVYMSVCVFLSLSFVAVTNFF